MKYKISFLEYCLEYIYMDTNKIINDVYFDPAGFGSIDKTFKDAKTTMIQ